MVHMVCMRKGHDMRAAGRVSVRRLYSRVPYGTVCRESTAFKLRRMAENLRFMLCALCTLNRLNVGSVQGASLNMTFRWNRTIHAT